MPTIDRYLNLTSYFDPETIRLLGTAFQTACSFVGHTAQPVAVREAIAKAIFEAAKQGERDVKSLRDAGLASIEPQYRTDFYRPGQGTGPPVSR
jgi:hypothetical protein